MLPRRQHFKFFFVTVTSLQLILGSFFLQGGVSSECNDGSSGSRWMLPSVKLDHHHDVGRPRSSCDIPRVPGIKYDRHNRRASVIRFAHGGCLCFQHLHDGARARHRADTDRQQHGLAARPHQRPLPLAHTRAARPGSGPGQLAVQLGKCWRKIKRAARE